MNITQVKRVIAGVGAASLLAAVLAVPVAAADTRFISIDDAENCAAVEGNAAVRNTLELTPVSAGNLTKLDLWVENCGGQNLSNIVLSIGQQPVVNGQPQWDTLATAYTDGTQIVDVFALSGAKCGTVPTALLTCTAKSLRAGAVLKLSAVLRAPTTGDGVSVYAAVKGAENTNDNGGNQDTLEATGYEAFTPGSCDSVTTFLSPRFPDAQTCELRTGNPQSAKVTFGSSFPIEVSEVPTGPEVCVSGNKTPVGQDVIADINPDGTDPSGVVTWTIQVNVQALQRNNVKAQDIVICHWDDNGVVDPPTSMRSTKSGGVINVTFTTDGNGRTRLLG